MKTKISTCSTEHNKMSSNTVKTILQGHYGYAPADQSTLVRHLAKHRLGWCTVKLLSTEQKRHRFAKNGQSISVYLYCNSGNTSSKIQMILLYKFPNKYLHIKLALDFMYNDDTFFFSLFHRRAAGLLQVIF